VGGDFNGYYHFICLLKEYKYNMKHIYENSVYIYEENNNNNNKNIGNIILILVLSLS
jgi:hypothetical protein